MPTRLRIVVNWSLCEANLVCAQAAPEVFEVDEQDKLHVLKEHIGEELRAKVERAVRGCPRRALAVVEEP
jgi:ferredoxin